MKKQKAENIHTVPRFAKGKLAPINRKSVPFGKFVMKLPVAPIVDLAPNYIYPMDGNDLVGDCVVAGWDHFRQVVTGLLCGEQKNFTQDEIWNFYKTQNPKFDPNGTESTNGPGSSSDCGMNVQFFLEYLQSQKLILGFARINPANEAEMKSAIDLGLGIITGVVLTEVQMAQYENGYWENIPGSPIDGGHCIPLVGYTGNPDDFTCVTWGKLVNCTENFISKQMDEAWFVLMQEHVDHPNFRNHFDLQGFSDAVCAITEGKIVIPVPKVEPGFTLPKFMTFYKNTPYAATAEACFDAVAIALAEAGILSDMTLIGALATARIEIGNKSYVPIRESISQAKANADYCKPGNSLENIPGSNDGYFFRGGGLPQLTGRKNYLHYAKVLNVAIDTNPDLMLNLGVSARVLAEFFKENGIDIECNNKNWNNVREKVNGGYNGLSDFIGVVNDFLSVI